MNMQQLVESCQDGFSDALGAHVTKRQARLLVNEVLWQIKEAVKKGGAAKLSWIGTLALKAVPARIVRNPKTGESLSRPASKRLKLSPSSDWKGIPGG